MDNKRQTSVQELRTIFTKSQLLGPHLSSQESLDSLNDQSSIEKTESEDPLESSQNAEKELQLKRTLPKPTISPKPTSLTPGSNAGIKNLVAALEGSHGMYTTRNALGHQGLTVKDVRESSTNYKSPEKVTQVTTSKLVRKETITFKQEEIEEESKKSLSSSCETSSTQDISIKENIGNNFGHEKNTLGIDKSAPNLQVSSLERSDGYDRPKNIVRESIIGVNNFNTSETNSDYIRRVVPSKEELGPAPPKPPKPNEMCLPLKEINNFNCGTSIHSSSGDSIPPPLPNRHPDLSTRPPARIPPKPPRSFPKEPLPDIPSPIPPDTSEYDLEEDDEEEIYNDVIFPTEAPSSSGFGADGQACPDDDIYDDHSPHLTHPSLPRYPPPLPPSTSHLRSHDNASPHFSGLSTNSNDSSENEDTDAIYEETPMGPEYVNVEEVDKEKKKQKKRALKSEQKTLEKIEKKREKFMKKFTLSGEEIPLDAGTVKNDSKGNKFDLSVIKGETVLILRMENNPSGKWLVKNGKGRVGYVELTNIQVDVESVKSVMVARTSQIITEEQLTTVPTE